MPMERLSTGDTHAGDTPEEMRHKLIFHGYGDDPEKLNCGHGRWSVKGDCVTCLSFCIDSLNKKNSELSRQLTSASPQQPTSEWQGIDKIPTGREHPPSEQKTDTSASSGAEDTTPSLSNEPVGASPQQPTFTSPPISDTEAANVRILAQEFKARWEAGAKAMQEAAVKTDCRGCREGWPFSKPNGLVHFPAEGTISGWFNCESVQVRALKLAYPGESPAQRKEPR